MINLSQELTDADYAQKVTVPAQDKTEDFEVPEKIGKYEVCEQLGRGTCGVVHRGFDPFVQRNVAIKIAHMNAGEEGGSKNSTTQTFFTEAHAAGKLQHPHIVSLFDAGIEDELNYIVMEYLEGETLEKYTRGLKRIPIDMAIDVVYKCCKALDYSHSQGIVHRDIKPTNIMITKDGDVKIMDFSIALMNANQAPGERSAGGAVGTPGYMSPEQVLGKEIGPTSDLYSLAVVMFEMLTGKRLFDSKTMRELFVSIIREPAPKLSSVRSDLPAELSQILEKALRKKPAERFKTGQEFAVGLGRVYDKLRLSEKHVTRNENRNMLQNLNFFNGFTDNEIDEILDASHLIQYKQGEVIINEGDVDNAFYIIVVGSASVLKADVLLDTLREGDCFGEIGFLMQTKRTASVIASADMLVLKVNALLMNQVATETQLHYYKAFVETLVYRLSVTSARLSALRARNEAEKRQQAQVRTVVEEEDEGDRTQPIAEAVAQVKAYAEAEAKAEAKAQAEAKANADSQAKMEQETNTGSQVQVNPETNAGNQAKVNPEKNGGSQAKVKPGMNADSQAKLDLEASAEAGPDGEAKAEADEIADDNTQPLISLADAEAASAEAGDGNAQTNAPPSAKQDRKSADTQPSPPGSTAS